LGLSARRNLCIHKVASKFREREKIDSCCHALTAEWVRASKPKEELCRFYEKLDKVQDSISIESGVFDLQDLKKIGKLEGICPYFLARKLISTADIIVYNYQYLLDPKIASIVSKEKSDSSIVIFDEAHNIDDACIEALTVRIRRKTLD